MTNWTLQKVIGVYFLIVFGMLVLEMKLLGAYYYSPLEYQGYCKLNHGEDFKRIENECIDVVYGDNYKVKERIVKPFTEEEFKEYCVKLSLTTPSFFSECWRAGK